MPSVNIYTNRERIKPLEKILEGLREVTAKELSCEDRTLESDEISLRVLAPDVSLQKADTELEIKAYSFDARVKRQDKICRSIKDYVERTCPKAGSVYVWLQLSELCHSAEK